MPYSFVSYFLRISIFRIAILLKGFCLFLFVVGFFSRIGSVFFGRSQLICSPQCHSMEILMWFGENYTMLTLLDLHCLCNSLLHQFFCDSCLEGCLGRKWGAEWPLSVWRLRGRWEFITDVMAGAQHPPTFFSPS